MEIKKAQRQQVKIKLGLLGPSGSGKTYSSLLLAHGITNDWSKIVVIDTENHSSELYSHLGNYKVINLTPPFSPERYIQAIEVAEKSNIEVIIVDSISHEWIGEGGIIDIHGKMTGNSFTNWNKITPRHNALIQKILQSDTHVICTIRSKQGYVLSEKNGKMVPEKIGLKGITREGFDYELTILFDINMKHNCVASKDRTGLFVDKPEFKISESIGERIKAWCLQDQSINDLKNEILGASNIKDLQDIYEKNPTYKKELYPMIVKRKEMISSSIIQS
jgi:AAA domain